ncbi:MAG: hypothetical protein NC393_11795 [Clostridium sp.]|nr:hypothetical protein [Clostridium sp.]MCM1172789.1 hypothetical protein [Clostridium sp.]MCM1208176.1 hypothetical protein [Ruminococcus sp.]
MKLKKLMRIFFVLFLISLFITIGLFIATKKQPINQETVTATVVSNEKSYITIRGVKSPRYLVTVRYQGHETKWYLSDGYQYRPMMQIQAYIAPDGSLAVSKADAQTNSKIGKLYFVFLAITGVLFMAFMIVYDKIWRIKHEKQKTDSKKSC